MDRDAVRQFAGRDWSAVDTSKTRFWHALKAGRSAADVLAVADRLRTHARRLRPDWPSAQERLDDLRVHQRVGEALRAVARRPR